jgi:hypothetical protein
MPDVAAATEAFERRNKNDLSILREDTVPGIVRTVLALRRNLQTIRGNVRNSIQAMTDDTLAARTAAAKALDTLEATAKMAIQNVRDDITKATAVKLDTQEAILDQLNLQSAQRRVDQMRAAKVDAMTMIQRAAAAGDTLVLRVLRQELPSNAGSDYASQQRLERLMDQLDLVETPLLSGVRQAARLLETELEVGSGNLSASFQIARGEVTGGSNSSSYYPTGVRSIINGWAAGSTVNVSETQPDGGNTSPDTPVASGTTGVDLAHPNEAIQKQLDAEYYRYNPK